MLYILGGTSRSGKSIIADKLLEKGIPFFSTDFLMMGLERGLPEFGVNSNDPAPKIATKIWPIIKEIAITLIDINQDYLIEGDSLLPELVKNLIDEKGEHLVKVCFIGYKDISPEEKVKHIKEFPSDKNNWINYESDEYILKFLTNEKERSSDLAKKCEEVGIKYIDMSFNFDQSVDKVTNYLLAQEP